VSTETVDRGDNLGAVEDVEGAVVAAPETKEPKTKEPEGKEPEGAEPEGKEPDAKEPERDDKGRFIPTERHKAVLEKERAQREAAENRIKELEARLQQTEATQDVAAAEAEITQLELEYSKLLLDGDHVKAAETMTTIRHKSAALAEARQVGIAEQVAEQRTEKDRMAVAISGLEETYPALRDGGEEFDQDLVDDVLDLQLVYINRDRMAPSVALLKAAERVMKRATGAEEPAGKKPSGLAAAQVVEDRKKAQVAKNIDTAQRQPASTKESGLDSDKAGIVGAVDVSRMSAEEFAALPEATKSRLRGDSM
jgi:hypothetical protein